jgi:amidophosphoribosyltransferase
MSDGYIVKFKDGAAKIVMCGIFGVYGHPAAAHLTLLGLQALQHRGQEGVGMTVSDREHLRTQKSLGLIREAKSSGRLKPVDGPHAVGHVRYSTAGDMSLRSVQPLAADHAQGSAALVHNGNLVNAAAARRHLEHHGSIFQSASDSEVILHLFFRTHDGDLVGRLASALAHVEGAYSLLLLGADVLLAARDPRGFRPLCIGTIEGAFVFASETAALDLVGAKLLREVEPGEIVAVDGEGLRSFRLSPTPVNRRFCVFEHVYFAHLDSHLDGRSIYAVREALGRRLAMEHQVEADYDRTRIREARHAKQHVGSGP